MANNGQGSAPAQNQRGRGGGYRGRFSTNHGRGQNRRGRGRREHTGSTSVPNALQVVPGTGVSVILKADQPTGRQVQGIVDQVLGRGDHPRGIKVQLIDGRVGRVQSLVDEETARNASASLSNLGRNGEPGGNASYSEINTQIPFSRGRRHYSDIRENDSYDYDNYVASRDSPSLADYIREPKNPRNAEYHDHPDEFVENHTSNPPTSTSAPCSCPICGLFEGDEAAVAFHVEGHFT